TRRNTPAISMAACRESCCRVAQVNSPVTDRQAGRFVAVGHHGLRLTSPDGQRWTDAQLGKEGETYRAAAFGNGHFATVGSYGGDNIFAATENGSVWQTGKREAKYVHYLRGLGFGKGMFLGLGGDPGAVGDSKPFVMTSSDGMTWSDATMISGKNMLR